MSIYESSIDPSGNCLYKALNNLLVTGSACATDQSGKPTRYDENRNGDIDAIIISTTIDDENEVLEILHVLIYQNGDIINARQKDYCLKNDVLEGAIIARAETRCDFCPYKEICHATSKFPVMLIKKPNDATLDVLKNLVLVTAEQSLLGLPIWYS